MSFTVRILQKYIAKEFAKPFIFTAILFAVVIQIGHLFDRLQVFIKEDVPIKIIVPYLFAMVPLWLVQALPMCTLIASVLTLGNMASSGELFCLRASGISMRTIIKPLFVIGGSLVILTFILGDTVMPWATSYGRTLYRTYVDKVGLHRAAWDDIIVLLQDKKRISAKHFNLTDNSMEKVIVEEYGPDYSLRQELKAERAEWTQEKGWFFYEGIIRLFSKSGDEIVEEVPFAAARLNIQDVPTDMVPQQILPQELSVRELKAYIQHIQNLGISSLREEVQLHLKFSFPFTHFLVLIVGIPIALKTTPAGGGRGQKGFERMKSLSWALLVGFAYMMLITVGQALGESRKAPPWLGIWLANLIFFIFGIILFRKIE